MHDLSSRLDAMLKKKGGMTFEEYFKSNESQLSEGISAGRFADSLVSQMQKYLPKDRWTVEYELGDVIVTNDFGEKATFRIMQYESNEGTFRYPNIPAKGSADE